MFQIVKLNRKWSFLIYSRQTWEPWSVYIPFPFIAGASMLLPAGLTAAWAAPGTALRGTALLCIKIIQCRKDGLSTEVRESQIKSSDPEKTVKLVNTCSENQRQETITALFRFYPLGKKYQTCSPEMRTERTKCNTKRCLKRLFRKSWSIFEK